MTEDALQSDSDVFDRLFAESRFPVSFDLLDPITIVGLSLLSFRGESNALPAATIRLRSDRDVIVLLKVSFPR